MGSLGTNWEEEWGASGRIGKRNGEPQDELERGLVEEAEENDKEVMVADGDDTVSIQT